MAGALDAAVSLRALVSWVRYLVTRTGWCAGIDAGRLEGPGGGWVDGWIGGGADIEVVEVRILDRW